jgi:hypothetical protein
LGIARIAPKKLEERRAERGKHAIDDAAASQIARKSEAR